GVDSRLYLCNSGKFDIRDRILPTRQASINDQLRGQRGALAHKPAVRFAIRFRNRLSEPIYTKHMGLEGWYIGFTDQVIEVHDDPGPGMSGRTKAAQCTGRIPS